MSNLSPCPSCGNPVSRFAQACPKCGEVLRRPSPQSTSRLSGPGKVIAGVFGALLTLALVIFILSFIVHVLHRVFGPSPLKTTPAVAEPPSGEVSQRQFGAAWPFTVDRLTLSCQPDPKHPDSPYLVATVGEKTYSLAWSIAHKDYDYSNIDEIRKEDPATGQKISLLPMIDRASALCPPAR